MVNQAFIAAKAGAFILSPFIGGADDFGADGIQLLKDVITMVNQYEFETEVMAVSVCHPYQARQVILCGASVITLPFDVLKKMFYHPVTDAGISDFLNAAKNN